MPGEGERWEVERDRHGIMFSGPLEVGEMVEVVPASRLEAAESALTEALDAIAKHQRAIDNGDTASRADDSLWNAGERIRSQIEGSNE